MLGRRKAMQKQHTTRVHIWVTGRVQGVGFRAFVQRMGVSLGITGWVRNVGDDRVEAVAEGPQETLDKFAELLKNGPTGARVDEARLEWETPTAEFRNFHIKYSI
jgi:acylphosphatase